MHHRFSNLSHKVAFIILKWVMDKNTLFFLYIIINYAGKACKKSNNLRVYISIAHLTFSSVGHRKIPIKNQVFHKECIFSKARNPSKRNEDFIILISK